MHAERAQVLPVHPTRGEVRSATYIRPTNLGEGDGFARMGILDRRGGELQRLTSGRSKETSAGISPRGSLLRRGVVGAWRDGGGVPGRRHGARPRSRPEAARVVGP